MALQALRTNYADGVDRVNAALFNGNNTITNANNAYLQGLISTGGSGGDDRIVPDDATADDINAAILAQWADGGGTVRLSADTYNLNKTVHFKPRFTDTGTAQAGSTSTTIKLAAGASTNDFDYYFGVIKITSGTGSGQVRVITAYNHTTKVATVRSAWTTTPDATSVYAIQYHSSAQWTVTVKGNSDTGTKLVAASGFVDDSFDGKSIVVRREAGINERAGSTSDLTIDAAGNANYALYDRGTVEHAYEKINLQGAVICPLVMDASQNFKFENVRCMGGQYSHIIMNGAASFKFDRFEMTNASVDTTLYTVDSSFPGYNWYTGVLYPLMGAYGTGLMEIPSGTNSAMVPLRILAGVGITFDDVTFATQYYSGTKAEGCVVLGDGSGTYPIEDIHFNDCQFYRGGETSASDYIVTKDHVLGTLVEDCRWTGGYSGGGDVAIRAHANSPVSVRGWKLRDSPKVFVGNIHARPNETSWTTGTRPSVGSVVIPPGLNKTTGLMEYFDGSAWLNVDAGGGSGGEFTYTQASPAATWTITNTLGRYPSSVSVWIAGEEVETQVETPDVSTIVVTFASAQSGRAEII